ncbi:MAG: hypothetical protein IKH10_00140, partial [Bacteroidetes bacterium]|nr:hypothetical protein [Bacteroidota bacterium]
HTKNETNIEKFEIERRSSENIFKTIATEKAKGYSTNYSYRDSDCFYKNSQSNELLEQANISYRLKIIFSNNTHVYSDEAILLKI